MWLRCVSAVMRHPLIGKIFEFVSAQPHGFLGGLWVLISPISLIIKQSLPHIRSTAQPTFLLILFDLVALVYLSFLFHSTGTVGFVPYVRYP